MATKKSSPPPADDPATGPREPAAKGLTKREMVQQAVAAGKAKPRDGVAWIKEQFGETMTPATFSVTKSQLREKGAPSGAPKKRGRKPMARPEAAVVQEQDAPKPAPQGYALSHSEAARAVKELVEKIGAEEVIDLARLLSGR